MLSILFFTRKKQAFYKAFFLFFCSFFALQSVNAADVSLKLLTRVPRIGSPISVGVYVEKNTTSINAASLTIRFDQKKVLAQSISKKDTLIQMWSENPRFSNADGTAHVEGVILNPGFSGSSGLLATIIFTPRAEGATSFAVSDAHVYANDGNATDVIRQTSPLSVDIGPRLIADTKEVRTEENVATSSQPAKLIAGDVVADQRVILDEISHIVSSSTTFKLNQSLVIEDAYDKPKYTKYVLTLNGGEKVQVDASILGKTLIPLPKAHLRENSLDVIAYDAYGGEANLSLPFYVSVLPSPKILSLSNSVSVNKNIIAVFKTVEGASVRLTIKNNYSLFIGDAVANGDGIATVTLPVTAIGSYSVFAKAYKDGGESDEVNLAAVTVRPTISWFFSSSNPSRSLFWMIVALILLIVLLVSLVVIRSYRKMVDDANNFLFMTLGKRAEEEFQFEKTETNKSEEISTS